MSLRRETWDTNPCSQENQLFSNGWSFDCFDQNYHQAFPPNSFSCQQVPQSYNHDYTYNEIYSSLLHEFSAPQVIDSSSYNTKGICIYNWFFVYPFNTFMYRSTGYIHHKKTRPHNQISLTRWTIKWTIMSKNDGGKYISIWQRTMAASFSNSSNLLGSMTLSLPCLSEFQKEKY